MRPVVNEVNLLAAVIVEQPIIQTAVSSVETFDDTKSKFETETASLKNAAPISGQNILHIAFLMMVGSPLTSANNLRGHIHHKTWQDLKNKLPRQYSTVPFEFHATQSFAHFQQGSDELL